MQSAQPAVADFLPLTPAIHRHPLALADEERHGYGIMLEVARLTGGTRMGPGPCTATAKRLLAAGLTRGGGRGGPAPERTMSGAVTTV